MQGRFVRTTALGAAVLLLLLAVPASSWAGGPGKWTKLATVDNQGDTFGMLRTLDGKLHLVWLKARASNNTQSYGTATISLAGQLMGTGTALSGWTTLEADPQLVKDGTGLRLVFEGNTGTPTSCFEKGEVFTETSTNGSAWNLVTGSLSSHTVGVGNLAATAEPNGTPVDTFAGGGLFHVGVDPSCPATQLDGTIPVPTGNAPSNPSIVTASDGSVWVASFQAFAKEGYFVTRIVPTVGPATEAPGSASTAAHNNQPLEPVALAARVGGGVYMAYCAASSSQPCAHIDLWKVGAPKPTIVPGSKNTTSARVALTAAPKGRLAVTWFNSVNGKSVIHSVRTNTAANSFGALGTIKLPAHTTSVTDLQTQDSSGRQDVLINAQVQVGTKFPIELLQTQILPGLTLKASPGTFSHKHSATVTFTVLDAGQPVAGAKVACLGKSAITSNTGEAKLHFSKGTAPGKHVCTAGHPNYNFGKTTLKVT
jgi:hypothetical protein